MNRIDRFLTTRVLVTTLTVVAVFFAIIGLGESLDGTRYALLTETRDENTARLAIVLAAARWSLKALPVTILLGSIVALLNLQVHRELLIMKASGLSIWQIARGPVLSLLLIGGVLSTVVDAQVTVMNRDIMPSARAGGFSSGNSSAVWLEQVSRDGDYILSARSADANHLVLRNVVVFGGPDLDVRRIEAGSARLADGVWVFSKAKVFRPNLPAKTVARFELDTGTTQPDLDLKLSSTEDLTFFELAQLLAQGSADAGVRSAAATRFARLMAAPVLLVGTLLIAFAVTAGYRRSGSYGNTITYGIIMGFVMFVVNEMSDRAGSAGILSPNLAAWGPAMVAVIIGLTMLLYKEDGRA